MKFNRSPKKIIFTIFSSGFLLLSGCGDSSTNEISAEEFNIFDQTGTWKKTFYTEEIKTETISDTNAVIDSSYKSTSPVMVRYSSDDDISANFCDRKGEIQVGSNFTVFPDNPDDSCDVKYTKIGEDHIKAEEICDDQKTSTLEFEKINGSDTFYFGDFNFAYIKDNTFIPSPNFSIGVCASVSTEHTIASYSPQPNDAGLEDSNFFAKNIDVEAAFNSDKASINFGFVDTSEIIKDGEYTAIKYMIPQNEKNEVLVTVTSPLFAETGNDIGTLQATGGIVKISQFHEENTTAIIYYNLDFENGENIFGNLSVEY